MIFFTDTSSEQTRIEKALKKYGYAPEHNFWWYQCQAKKDSKTVFAQAQDGSGLLTIEERSKKKCTIFSSPVAPAKRRVAIILEYLDSIFQSDDIRKINFELEDELYKNLKKALPKSLKSGRINCTLTWPIYKLEMFDPSLSGHSWKTLRKTKNRFYNKFSVSISDAKTYKNTEELHSLMERWRKKRTGHDRTLHSPYHNFIDKNFMGADEARVLIVDGKACGINAGWIIKNSAQFYGALGIHDYSLPGLGDVLYLEDLTYLKTHGYKEANMGGGEKTLTEFKNKFHPQSSYKTHYFSVIKR